MNPVVEIYRGVAAMMVMLCHYKGMVFGGSPSWMGFLWTGVDFFFVISGFVFGPHVLNGKINIVSFFVRRFFRIYPLYLLSLGVYFFITPDSSGKIGYLLHHFFMLHTVFSKEEAFFFNPAFWSLPPEVEYYFLIPFLSFWVKFSVRRLILVAIFALVIHLVVFSALSELQNSKLTLILSVHLPGLLVEFLIGILSFYAFRGKLLDSFYVAMFSLVLAIGALVFLGWYFVMFGDAGVSAHPVFKLTFNVFCAVAYGVVLVVSVSLMRGRELDPFFMKIAIFSGQVSFGVYLFHNAIPLFFDGFGMPPFIRLFLCGSVVVILSFVMNRIYEAPLQQYGVFLSRKIDLLCKNV